MVHSRGFPPPLLWLLWNNMPKLDWGSESLRHGGLDKDPSHAIHRETREKRTMPINRIDSVFQ
jgi:hypothetical protein